MRDRGGDMGLREHLRVVRDDHTLGDLRRDLIALGKDVPGKLSRPLSVVDIEWKHSEIPHQQILDLVPDRILGQRDGGNVKPVIT